MSRIQRLPNSSRREANEDPDDVVPSFRQSLSCLATLKDRKVAPKRLPVELLQPFDHVWWHNPFELMWNEGVHVLDVGPCDLTGASMSDVCLYRGALTSEKLICVSKSMTLSQ